MGQGCRLFRQVSNYILGTVGQDAGSFKRCRNLPPRDCWAGVQAVKVVSEATSQSHWGRCAGFLRGVLTYLPVTVGQVCRLFTRCPKLPPGHCGAGVQAV